MKKYYEAIKTVASDRLQYRTRMPAASGYED